MSEAAEVATPETIHPAPVFALEAFETRAIPLRDLHESLKNPRRIYVGIEELAESIRKEGLRVAIVARPRIDQGSGFEIAAGHRRYRAAKLAGVEVVPVHVRDLTDAQLVDWLAFENDHRENPNDLERAQGWQLWMDENAAGVPDLIEKTGLKPAYVYKTLKLLEAIPEAQEAYVHGKIKVSHLEQIARIPTLKGQRLALRACEPSEFDPEKVITSRELKVWIGKNLHVSLADAPFSVADPLLTAAGACEPCPHRLGNAEDFTSEDLPYMCTRRECYDDKVHTHVNAVVADVLHGRKDLVLVSELGGSKPDGVLPKGDWYEARSGEASAKPAFVVEGPHIGREIRVVVQERIPSPAPPAIPQTPEITVKVVPADSKPKKTAAQIEQERKAREDQAREEREQEEERQRVQEERARKLRTEASTRLAILTETLKRVKWPPRREDVARLISHTVGGDVIAGLPEALDNPLAEIFGVREYRFVDLAALAEDNLAKLAALLTVIDDFDDFAIQHGCDPLHALAKRHGVNVEAIRKQAMEAEGGTRKAVIKNLPALNQAKKAASAKKNAPPKKAPVKKAAPKAAAKKVSKKGLFGFECA